MTAAGQSRKSWTAIAAVFASLALAVCAPAALRAATSERVVVDPNSGLALYGFDPVSYFTESQPALGAADFEYRFAGVSWRFRNAGNRAAFAADPEVYTPRYGGYDPLGVARGVATPGHPQLWARRDDRIYLFHKPESRAAFAADPDGAVAAAEGRWPQVVKDLVQ
jgi:hypothetical protein